MSVGRLVSMGLALLATEAAWPALALDFISIGTGGIGGSYYPTGRAICDLVNRQAKGSELRCSVEATSGSVYNLDALAAGDLDLAIVQSDVQYDAFNGRGRWAGRAMTSLRSVFAIYPEPVIIVASDASRIHQLDQLQGKRLNIGNPGSGTRATWEVIETALGWDRGMLRRAAELRTADAGPALCDTRIDAYLVLEGSPSPRVVRTLDSCPSHLVDIAGPAIDRLVEHSPYYSKLTVSPDVYGLPRPIETFGGSATLVSSERVPDHIVHAVATAALKGIAQLRDAVPPMAGLEIASMRDDTLTAPLHAGAGQAFREQGLER